MNKAVDIVFALLYIIAAAYSLFLAVLGTVTFLFFFSAILLHNIAFWRMDRALEYSIKHPPSSEMMEHHTFFGKRLGYKMCTYEAGEIRSTSLSTEKLLGWYADQDVDVFELGGHIPVRAAILDASLNIDIDDPAREWANGFVHTRDASNSSKTYYLVYLYKPDYSWFGDYRCLD